MLAVCTLAFGMDRKTGNPRSVYLEKGSVSLSLSGGYNHVDAGSLTGGSNYSLMGLIGNLSGKADIYDVNFSGAWFFANNFSVVGRVGYSGLDIHLDSSSVLGNLEFNNKHINRPMLTLAAWLSAAVQQQDCGPVRGSAPERRFWQHQVLFGYRARQGGNLQ